jgi:endonuclease YncB( thermonuclease family)
MTGVATAACVLASIAGEAVAAETRCAADEHARPATVTAVIDGDTIAVSDGSIVRLAGVEAPRRPLGLADSRPWPTEEESRLGLSRFAPPGTAVIVAPVGDEPDRYGRWRASVFVVADGRWLQEELVAAGLGRVRWFPGDPACVFALLGMESQARQQRLGLWSAAEYAVRQAADGSLIARNGLYELVEGRVASVGRGDYMTFVDFGRDYWRDFSIMVVPPVADRFAEAGIPIEGLVGRRIRVRGLIEDSGGPAIRLNDPSEVEFLDDVGASP